MYCLERVTKLCESSESTRRSYVAHFVATFHLKTFFLLAQLVSTHRFP